MAQVSSQKNLNRNISYAKMNDKANLNDLSATGSSSKVENQNKMMALQSS